MTIETDSGSAANARDTDFIAMPDSDENEPGEPIGSDSASLRAVAEQRSDAPIDATVREYLDRDGRRAPANEAISLARAARDYSGALATEKLVVESETAKTLAGRVDALRAEALAHDPGAAEFYGFELPEDAAGEVGSEGVETGGADSHGDGTAEGLAPEVEKALQHPQIRQALEEQIAEVERARQEYLGGLSAATQVAQMSFLGQFPELANTAPDQLPAALEQMSRQDPAKFAHVQALVATGQQLLAEQQQEGWRQMEIAQRNFQNYARSEDTRFAIMLKGESRETQRAVALEIAASARASGIETNELVRLFNSEPLMRNAVFQRMMYDAGKYRLMMKARDAAVTKQVPPVQRPGAAQTRAEREGAELRTLSARLSNSGDIKDAVALYHARKSGRK